MKTFVINLPDRKDRMQRFNANNPYLEYETFKAVEGYRSDMRNSYLRDLIPIIIG